MKRGNWCSQVLCLAKGSQGPLAADRGTADYPGTAFSTAAADRFVRAQQERGAQAQSVAGALILERQRAVLQVMLDKHQIHHATV